MTLDWKQVTKYPHAYWQFTGQLKPHMTDDTTKHTILVTHIFVLAGKQWTRITGFLKIGIKLIPLTENLCFS